MAPSCRWASVNSLSLRQSLITSKDSNVAVVGRARGLMLMQAAMVRARVLE